jgi:hypothetical protein
VLTAAIIVGAGGTAFAAAPGEQARPAAGAAAATPELQTVSAAAGSIRGTVSDERGGPLSGAMVTVLGATTAMTVTDVHGRFSLDTLPLGEYVLRAHLPGFAAPRRELVRLAHSTTNSVYRLQMRRLDQTIASRVEPPVPARPIMAAGFGLPSSPAPAVIDDGTKDDHPHNDTAWRLRHIKRSILKDSGSIVALGTADAPLPDPSLLTRTVDTAGSFAAALFGDLPFSGEVNLLTTGAFGPGQLFAGDVRPRGVAYLSIGAPTPAGDWSVRTAMSQGDLSSWVLAGAFASRRGSSHEYNLALSYGTQEYHGGNPAALAAVGDGGRYAGEVQAWDRWAVTPKVTVDYGGRYAYYGYLPHRGLFSPRAALAVEPVRGTRVTATVGQRSIAPGAEEFLAPNDAGPWLPPERTFAPVAAAQQGFRVQRARTLEFLLEQEFDDRSVIGLRRFYQTVDNQLVTLFALDLADAPQSSGHYYVAAAGGVDAHGWGLRWSSPASRRVRASVDYSVTTARWIAAGELMELSVWAPSAVRLESEGLHDITTSFGTDIPETATRVHLLYKINSAYSRASADVARPGLDARFDVQVNQGLPFGLPGTKWEVLVGLRNVFRDPSDPGSVYDELLVVRPPKRVVGGFLVRF